MNNIERYDRQLRVPGFGTDAQQRLQDAQVLLIGAGGLGFAVGCQLTGAGVGNIQVVDSDTVSITNLHRQWLYTESQLGLPKAELLANHLRALNSETQVCAHTKLASPGNIHDLVSGVDIIVDAADNFATSYLLSDVAEHHGIALVSASVNQRYGYVGQFCSAGDPSFRAVFPKVSNSQTSCDLVGVSGPAVTVIAGLQAQASLDFLTGSEHRLAGKVLYLDMLKYTVNLMDCSRAEKPSGSIIELIAFSDIHTQDWVIDVREESEVQASPQIFNVDQFCPMSSFRAKDVTASENVRTIVACQSGQRAMLAAQQLLYDGRLSVAVVLPSDN